MANANMMVLNGRNMVVSLNRGVLSNFGPQSRIDPRLEQWVSPHGFELTLLLQFFVWT